MMEDLSDLYENAPCAYLTILPDGTIGIANRTLSVWLGQSADNLVGKRFSDILSFGARIAYETHLGPMLRLQGSVDEVALDLVGASGDKIPTLASGSAKKGADGSHIYSRVAIFKAAERRSYERTMLAARESAKELLKKSDSERGEAQTARELAEATVLAQNETGMLREQFIAVLGHDLRNPLAAITSGVHLLGSQALNERGRLILDSMGQSVTRATLLTNNILDFARGRLGEGLILERDKREPLTPVLQQVVEEVRSFVPGRAITTKFEIKENLDCDRQRLGQLAANLVSNAVTHGAPEIPITVEAYTTESEFIFSVSNGGDPIPEDTRTNLFQPFFRGASRPSQQGLGLGLFIVSEIAKAHDGKMEVTSDSDKTSFTFSMPLR